MPIPSPSSIDVLILTPIGIEFESIRSFMQGGSFFTDPVFSKVYYTGSFQQEVNSVRIALRETGSGHLATAKAVQEGMQLFKPQVLVLFGTAGGLRKVKIGDIIIATSGSSYESGRVVDDGFYNNIKSLPTHQRIREKASILVKQPNSWKNQVFPAIAMDVNVYFGPIVSGDKVIASDQAPLRKMLRERHYDALGLEMEAYAFLDVARSYPDTETLIIRGVSDLLGNKDVANSRGSKVLAVTNAAAFLRTLLLQDDVLITPPLYYLSSKRVGILLGLIITLSVLSLLWIRSPYIGAITSTNPFPGNTIIKQRPQSPLADNTGFVQQESEPLPKAATPNKKATPPVVIKTPVPEDQLELPPINPPTNTSHKNDSIASSGIISSELPAPLLSSNTVDTVAIMSAVDLPTFVFKIYLENQKGKTIHGATYLIDGKPIQLVRNKAYLTPGIHQLEIHYSNYEPIKTLIDVPPIDNEQTTQRLFIP